MKRFAQRVWQHKLVSAAVVLALVVVAVAGIFHAQIIDGFITARDSLVRTFAFGFVPTLIWVVALALVVWKRRHLLERRYWNRWAAALVGTVVVWGGMGYLIGYEGILNEVSLGGEIGQAIKGPSDILGGVRLLALAAAAITIASPTGTLRWLRKSAHFTGRAARKAARALPVLARGARAAGRTVARAFSLLRRESRSRPPSPYRRRPYPASPSAARLRRCEGSRPCRSWPPVRKEARTATAPQRRSLPRLGRGLLPRAPLRHHRRRLRQQPGNRQRPRRRRTWRGQLSRTSRPRSWLSGRCRP